MSELITEVSHHLYSPPNIHIGQKRMRLDLLSNTFMRAPGEALGNFALESAIDELAWELDMDPARLRMLNEPERSVGKQRFTHRMLRQAYALGAEQFGWKDRDPRARSMRDGRWLVGMAVASAHHTSMRMPTSVSVRVDSDGTVLLRCALHEMGMGGAPIFIHRPRTGSGRWSWYG